MLYYKYNFILNQAKCEAVVQNDGIQGEEFATSANSA